MSLPTPLPGGDGTEVALRGAATLQRAARAGAERGRAVPVTGWVWWNSKRWHVMRLLLHCMKRVFRETLGFCIVWTY